MEAAGKVWPTVRAAAAGAFHVLLVYWWNLWITTVTTDQWTTHSCRLIKYTTASARLVIVCVSVKPHWRPSSSCDSVELWEVMFFRKMTCHLTPTESVYCGPPSPLQIPERCAELSVTPPHIHTPPPDSMNYYRPITEERDRWEDRLVSVQPLIKEPDRFHFSHLGQSHLTLNELNI